MLDKPHTSVNILPYYIYVVISIPPFCKRDKIIFNFFRVSFKVMQSRRKFSLVDCIWRLGKKNLTMFMVKSNNVHHLMDYCCILQAAIVQRQNLDAACSSYFWETAIMEFLCSRFKSQFFAVKFLHENGFIHKQKLKYVTSVLLNCHFFTNMLLQNFLHKFCSPNKYVTISLANCNLKQVLLKFAYQVLKAGENEWELVIFDDFIWEISPVHFPNKQVVIFAAGSWYELDAGFIMVLKFREVICLNWLYF